MIPHIIAIIILWLIILSEVVYFRRIWPPMILPAEWHTIMECEWQQKKTMLYRRPAAPPRVCVVSYENRTSLPYLDKFKQINMDYCDKHGYDYRFINDPNLVDIMSPYWIKVKLVIDILPYYDYVAWLDSDAFVCDTNIRIENVFNLGATTNEWMVITSDHNVRKSEFNAGVWIVKNCPKAHRFFQDWMNLYPANRWHKNGGKWICKKCKWAGSQYEQGAGTALLKHPSYRDGVMFLSKHILQAHKRHDNAFICHFYDEYNRIKMHLKMF